MWRDDDFIASLCPSFDLDLDCYNFQFLWLIPIIEIMWADGHCHPEEIETLFRCVDRFVDRVKRDTPEITGARARRFFQPFLDPTVGSDARKRTELSRLSDYIVAELVSPALRDKRTYLFRICLEVAAAAGHGGERGDVQRISEEEEKLLLDLFRELRLDRGK